MAKELTTPYVLSVVVATLMAAQAALGRLLEGQYRDVAWIRATWFGNDLVTLLLAVPLLVTALVHVRRGSVRALILWLGVLGYGAYNYAYYVLGAALNAFLPLYVVLVVLSVVTLILVVSRVDASKVPALRAQAPVRAIGGYFVFVAVGLSLVCIQGSLYLIALSVNAGLAISEGTVAAPGELPVWGALAVATMIATAALLRGLTVGGGGRMIQIVWEFIVKEVTVDRFVRAYGPDGEWSRLFQEHPGFLGTTLLRDVENPRRFLTIDVWETRRARDRMLSLTREEYSRLDDLFADLTESEAEIGVFESEPSHEGDEVA